MPVCDVHWEVTNGCNLHCPHCVQCSGLPRAGELTTVEAYAVIDRLSAAGVRRICWTGGDPFVRRDFFSLVKRAAAIGLAQAVITNATLISELDVRTLASYGIPMGISLDGTTARVHDSVRGGQTFPQVVKVIDWAIIHHVPVTVYTTVIRRTLSDVVDVIAYAHRRGLRLHINEVSLAGRAEQLWPWLGLSEAQRQELVTRVSGAAQEHFGETLAWEPDGCWADGTAVYLRSDGQVFLCSEQVQHAHSAALGHILERPLDELLQTDSVGRCADSMCSYRVLASPNVTLIVNHPVRCPLVPPEPEIRSLDECNQAFDALYAPFAEVCRTCTDKCCQGYVWLMPEELTRMQESGVETITVNDAAHYIHSFPEKPDGSIDVSVPSPLCSQLCSLQPRRCRVYQDRPFSCRLYPIGFEERDDGKLVWAIHHDCQIIRSLEQSGMLDEFRRRALQVLDRISPELYARIIETYRRVQDLATFPDGNNNISSLKEVKA